MRQSPIRRGLALALTLALASACSPTLSDPGKGKVALTVKWPAKIARFTIQALPETATRVEVEIVGDGIAAETPYHKTLTPNGADTTTDFLEVPIGPKVVRALAYDDGSHLVATGERAVAVVPNDIVEAHIVMRPATGIEPAATPTPGNGESPSGSPLPSASPGIPATPPDLITTAAGDGLGGSIDAPNGLQARFHYPSAIAYDRRGKALYIADDDRRRIRRYDLVSHGVTTLAILAPEAGASPSVGATLGSGSGNAAGLAIGPDGALYFSDAANHMIRKLLADGSVITVAGKGSAGNDDGAARAAAFNYPSDLAFDPVGNLYVADQLNHRIRRITPSGDVSTVVGTGERGYSGDGGRAIEARIDTPVAVAIAPGGGVLYFAESAGLRVRKVQLGTGIVDTVAGRGVMGTDGEGGSALLAKLSLPLDLAFDRDGDLLIADGWNIRSGVGSNYLTGAVSRIVRVTPDGRLVRLAGTLDTAYGYSGDGGDALLAQLNNPAGLAVDDAGNVYVSDMYNNRLRLVTPAVTPTPAPTVAPSPAPTPSGDQAPD